MIKLVLAALLLASPAKALISVMEGLATTKDAVFVGTTTPQLILNATSYNGTVPTVSLYASSNVVVGSNGCVLYSTGVIDCLGVRLSTGDPVGVYVPYTGATANPIKISSGGVVILINPNQSVSATTFQVITGSTLTFTVYGTTVACDFSGTMSNNGGDLAYMGVGVDGACLPTAATACHSGGFEVGLNVSSTFQASFHQVIQVTPGNHSFRLGLWTQAAGSTYTLGPNSSAAQNQLSCWEVLSK